MTLHTFPDVVVKKTSPLLSLGWYLFTVVSHNGNLTRDSNRNAHSITMNGNNVSVASWVTLLVTILFLDFVTFHLSFLEIPLAEFIEFSESWLNPKVVWLPETVHISQQIYSSMQ